MEEIRIDATTQTAEELALAAEHAQLIFKFNHTMPGTAEYASRCQASFQFYIRATARGLQPSENPPFEPDCRLSVANKSLSAIQWQCHPLSRLIKRYYKWSLMSAESQIKFVGV